MKQTLSTAIALALTLALAPSRGAAEDDKDRARALAREALDLLDGKNFEEARKKAAEAETLYHAPSHIFMIARSLEGLGRLTEAAAFYEQLVAEPLTSAAPKVFQDAQEQGRQALRDLLARIPTVLVRVSGAPPEKVIATVDGKPIAWSSGTAIRFDPGDHAVRVTAEGYKPFEEALTLPSRGGVVVVDAVLAPEARQSPGPGSSGAAGPTAGNSGADGAESASGGPLAPALVALGVGGAGLVVGAITGAMELTKTSDLKERCPQNKCQPTEKGDLDAAHTLATLSTVGFVAGGVIAAGGIVLLLVRPGGGHSPATGARIEPWIGAGSAGLRGRF